MKVGEQFEADYQRNNPMNQPIQENKEEYNGYKKIDGCYMCERYEKHWHDKVVSPQSKAPQNTSREEIRERWLLDNVDGKHSPDSAADWWLTEIEAAKKRGQETERERVRKWQEKWDIEKMEVWQIHLMAELSRILSAIEPKS